ncbi:VCBS repeat-containing protein [Streptomyces sp. 24-1644]|uniref:VCBS repeat-containing protein n=1 Tax=Streptomyces sp. 24-1644 TaxID=3457315 RepID=UPI003FA7D962
MSEVRRGRRRRTASVLAAVLLAIGMSGVAAATSAQAAGACVGGTEPDFNGDGVRDVAIADPSATVGGLAKAGLVRIAYGGGQVDEISQATANVADFPEEGDQFSRSLAVYDANTDGCSDLAVGIPHEDVDTVRDAGYVQIIFGSPAGLGKGLASTGFVQGANVEGSSAEHGDMLGYALAAGRSASGVAFLVVGVPGEDYDGIVDMGMIHFVYGTAYASANVSQASTGVWEDPEPNDRFGASVATTNRHFAVGVPGESLEAVQQAGAVNVFAPSINTDGIPLPLFGMGQGRTGTSDATGETGDQYASSLAMAPYRPATEATVTDSMLAVGVPNEDLGGISDAGAVQLYHIKDDRTVVQTQWLDQNTTGVAGDAERSDFFGQRLAAVNTATNVVSTAAGMRLAVGVPGEESDAQRQDEGGVQLFSMLGDPGTSDSWISPGSGIPSPGAPRMYTGISLGSAQSALYVGVPYGPVGGRAVYAFPWNTPDGGAPSQSWKPGQGGFPAVNAAFGATVR